MLLGWLILRNGACTLGLFRGMIERTTLTFNRASTPGTCHHTLRCCSPVDSTSACTNGEPGEPGVRMPSAC